MAADDDKRELAEAIDKVLQSKSRKKLVVAGLGAGKTTLFRKLLERAPGTAESRLVLTFINNLKGDLDRSLGDLATAYTLHGYCQSLLYRHEAIRAGLTAEFVCYPGLVSLIKEDWEWLIGSPVPAIRLCPSSRVSSTRPLPLLRRDLFETRLSAAT